MKSMRSLIVALVLAGLAAVVAWWAMRSESTELAAGAPAPAAPIEREVEAAPVEATRAEATRESVAPAEPAPVDAAPVEEPPAPAASAAPVFELRGRLVVVELDERETHEADGEIEFVLWSDSSGRHETEPVTRGEWTLAPTDVGRVSSVSIHKVLVDGERVALDSPKERTTLPHEGEFVVRVRRSAPTVLRVVDARSGADLTGVELVSEARFSFGNVRDQRGSIASGLRSPIDLTPFRSQFEASNVNLRVGADGYAFETVQLDLDVGGERLVALTPAGGLEVDVRGYTAPARVPLRLYARSGGAPMAEIHVRADGVVRFASLHPGEYELKAEIGEWFRNPVQLAGSKVAVVAGVVERVELLLEAAPVVQFVEAAGVLYVAREWQLYSPRLRFESLDRGASVDSITLQAAPAESGREGYDAFTWSHSKTRVGRHRLGLWKPEFDTVIDVPSGGRSDFELVIPPPVELFVRVLDDATSADVVTEQLMWNSARPEGVSGGGLAQAERDEERGGYRIRAPLGEIELHLWDWDYQPFNEKVRLTSAGDEHVIRLKRSCGVVLKLFDDRTPIALPENWHGGVKCASGEGRGSLTQHGAFERRFMVTLPGTYELELPELSGYKAVGVQRIEVHAGRFTEHVVQLEREHP